MQYAQITHVGRDSRLTVDFIYELEHLQSGLLRFTSIGGKFSTLVNPDTNPVEFEIVPRPDGVGMKGWRNTYAAHLWNVVYTQSLVDSFGPDSAAERADRAVGQFKERWEGTTFLHNVGQAE